MKSKDASLIWEIRWPKKAEAAGNVVVRVGLTGREACRYFGEGI
jgi:hypothetical protein